tara:strand:+ start:1792 stop:3237 length:1446 start_codon:yes stop_codon:yes gene_type:complete
MTVFNQHTSQHASFFSDLLGPKGFLPNSEDLSAYEVSWRGKKGKALCVLRPETSEQVSKIMAYAFKNDLHIIPQSGNTGLVDGATPDQSGTQIILNLERMAEIIEFDEANKSIHVGAGCRLSKLNGAVEDKHLFLPIDLGSDPCLGGMVSTNTGGSRYIKYRGMRDHILGIKVVLADEEGTIIDLISPVHKNNTGLDIKQLFIGSCGAFGIVTEVMVRLSPKPQQSATALIVPSSLDKMNELLIEIEKRCGTYLSAFEGMSKNAMTAAFEHNPSLSNPFEQGIVPDYGVLIELSRSWPMRPSEQSLDEVLETVLAEFFEADDPIIENAFIAPPAKLWGIRHSISEGVQKSGRLFAFDISMRRSQVMAFRQEIMAELTDKFPMLKLCDFGHFGDGAIHSSLVLPHESDFKSTPEFEKEVRAWVNDKVVKGYGGSFSAEHALGKIVEQAYIDYTDPKVIKMTAAIKKAIAPTKIGTIHYFDLV